jgi:signal transduction histidine kinase
MQKKAQGHSPLFQAIDDLPFIAWVERNDGAILYANQELARYTGRDVVLSFGLEQIVHHEDWPQLLRARLASEASCLGWETEARIKESGRQFRWHVIRAKNLSNGATNKADRLVMAVEIHRLKEINESCHELLRLTAHDLRNLMTSAVLQLELLGRELKVGVSGTVFMDATRKRIEICLGILRYAERFLKGLVDVTVLGLSKDVAKFQELDLSKTVSKVIDMMSVDAEARQCPLVCRLEPGVLGSWNELWVEQIVTNLLSNAIKYAPKSPVEITTKKEQSWAKLEIRDYGPGISENNQERIFRQFERACDNSRIEGTGLGLYIVKKFVSALGGRITVQSEIKKGTAFIVELPLAIAPHNCTRGRGA